MSESPFLQLTEEHDANTVALNLDLVRVLDIVRPVSHIDDELISLVYDGLVAQRSVL